MENANKALCKMHKILSVDLYQIAYTVENEEAKPTNLDIF